MTHNERLVLCGVCENRGYTSKLGVVCKLTNERPQFEDDCESFQEDAKAIQMSMREEEYQSVKSPEFKPSPKVASAMHGVNSIVVFGVVLAIIALSWLGIGAYYYNMIYYFPIGILVIGTFFIMAGILHKRKQKAESELLDDDI